MIIECPKCKSTFKVIDSIQIKSFSNFKCSVCNHVWKINIKNEIPKIKKRENEKNNYSYILILNAIFFMVVIVSLFIFKDKLFYANGYWKEFYYFFINLVPIK